MERYGVDIKWLAWSDPDGTRWLAATVPVIIVLLISEAYYCRRKEAIDRELEKNREDLVSKEFPAGN